MFHSADCVNICFHYYDTRDDTAVILVVIVSAYLVNIIDLPSVYCLDNSSDNQSA